MSTQECKIRTTTSTGVDIDITIKGNQRPKIADSTTIFFFWSKQYYHIILDILDCAKFPSDEAPDYAILHIVCT